MSSRVASGCPWVPGNNLELLIILFLPPGTMGVSSSALAVCQIFLPPLKLASRSHGLLFSYFQPV